MNNRHSDKLVHQSKRLRCQKSSAKRSDTEMEVEPQIIPVKKYAEALSAF